MSPVQIIEPKRHGDARGWFAETYSEQAFARRGIAYHFVQDNHSLSTERWTLRGLHFQTAPHAQAKLVRCIRGRIWDVAVDLRAGSPSFGRWYATELSAENGRQLFIDIGFAHGFLTLEEGCEVAYKVSDTYAPKCEGGLSWDDPTVAIPWPLPPGVRPLLSAKDEALPGLAPAFAYAGDPLDLAA